MSIENYYPTILEVLVNECGLTEEEALTALLDDEKEEAAKK